MCAEIRMRRMTTVDGRYTAEYWRHRAEMTRLQSQAVRDIDAKVTMFMVAEMYERLADRERDRFAPDN